VEFPDVSSAADLLKLIVAMISISQFLRSLIFKKKKITV